IVAEPQLMPQPDAVERRDFCWRLHLKQYRSAVTQGGRLNVYGPGKGRCRNGSQEKADGEADKKSQRSRPLAIAGRPPRLSPLKGCLPLAGNLHSISVASGRSAATIIRACESGFLLLGCCAG